MIRINLLPREKRPGKGPIRIPLAAIVTVTIVVLGGMWGYWFIVRRDVTRLRADIAATTNEIAKNQQIVLLVRQYSNDKKQLQDRLILVQRLAAAQTSPVRLLDGISQALPEGGWLTGMSKVAGRLMLQGYAPSHFVVAELMLALERLKPLMSNVELTFSELGIYEGRPVERFEILVTLSG